MRNDPAKLIQSWFAKHDREGEFTSNARACPYSVIGPADAAGRVIFTTKPTTVSVIFHRCGIQRGVGMIGRYGLPDDADLAWIRRIVGRRALLFLGDMDPGDLLVFAWLSARLRPRRVTHLGINDVLLEALRIRPSPSLVIPCEAFERKSLAFLNKEFPAFRETVGPRCAAMLDQGDKLELEAVLHGPKKSAATWRSLLLDADSRKKRQSNQSASAEWHLVKRNSLDFNA